MNSQSFDNLDVILANASRLYAETLKSEFLSAKPDFEMSEPTKRHILRMIRKDEERKRRRNTWKVVRGILVACLIAAALAFTACMAIPRVREAIWQTFVERNEEYMSINFVPTVKSYDASTAADASGASNASVTPPTSIKEPRMPSYLPKGYRTESSLLTNTFSSDYYDENDQFRITYTQMLVSTHSWVNSENAAVTETTVNGSPAVLISYTDDPDLYCLYWQDSEYRYSLVGRFENRDELLRLATSVEVK